MIEITQEAKKELEITLNAAFWGRTIDQKLVLEVHDVVQVWLEQNYPQGELVDVVHNCGTIDVNIRHRRFSHRINVTIAE
jgi:hypothetical protein